LIIVPDGILEATNLVLLREWLIKNCIIEKIIGLPKHEFAPYTHEKTYVLFLKKRVRPIEDLDEIKTERVWMYMIDCDGYANSDKKFRTDKTNENGKWLHDKLSIWGDTKGAFHVSLLEECWKRKEQGNNEEYTDEWGNKIEGLKYGYVNLKDILQEEYTNYTTIKKQDILKLLKQHNQSLKNILKKAEDLFEEVESNGGNGDEEENIEKELKEDYSNILSEKGIIYDSYEDKFYDTNQPKIRKLIKLVPEKYLRPKKIEKISFEEFRKQNMEIQKQIEDELL